MIIEAPCVLHLEVTLKRNNLLRNNANFILPNLVWCSDYCSGCSNLYPTPCNRLFINVWKLFLWAKAVYPVWECLFFYVLCTFTWRFIKSYSSAGAGDFSAHCMGRARAPGYVKVWDAGPSRAEKTLRPKPLEKWTGMCHCELEFPEAQSFSLSKSI